MSIKIMSYIWDHSPQKGTHLLMLLTIADHANDQGEAWPSIKRLAHRCRVGERQAQYIIRDLEESGELVVDHAVGRNHTSLYTIKGAAEFTFSQKVQSAAPLPEKKVHSSAEKVQPSAPEPSLEPSEEPKTNPPLIGSPRRGKPAKICPEDFQPSEKTREWAQATYPTLNLEGLLASMKNHVYRSPKRDWDLTFRNWIEYEADHKRLKPATASRAKRPEDMTPEELKAALEG